MVFSDIQVVSTVPVGIEMYVGHSQQLALS